MVTKEKILMPADKLLQSKEYLGLKKEVGGAVKEIIVGQPPTLEEIIPGLIIELENIESGSKEILEVISLPFPHPSSTLEVSLFVCTKSLTHDYESDRSLRDMGILPYKLTGGEEYNGWYRPVKWYLKEKSEI